MEKNKDDRDFLTFEKEQNEKDLKAYDVALIYGHRTACLVLNRVKDKGLFTEFQNEMKNVNKQFFSNPGTIEELNQKYDELITKMKSSIESINKEVRT